MNLFFRLLRVVLFAFFRPKVHFMDTGKVRFMVMPWDLDINAHMTNSRYLSIMDLGRTDLLIRSGLGKIAWRNKWGSVLGSATVRWRLGLKLFQVYELQTKAIGWDDKWFYLDQKVIHDNKVVAHAIAKAIFVTKGKSLMASDIVAELADSKVSPISPPIPEAILRWNESEEAMRQEAHDFTATYLHNQ